MATSNTNGAPAPDQPEHPFIEVGDAEGTQIQIDAVLAFIQEYEQGQIEALKNTTPPDNAHVFGLIWVLAGVRDAVKYLSGLVVPAGNLEGKS